MNWNPKRTVFIFLASMLWVFSSCEALLDIEVGVLWRDDPLFDQTGDTHLCILEGKWDSVTGFDHEAMESSQVFAGINDVYKFSVNTRKSDSITAFIFIDNDENGLYDEGYDTVMGYKYNDGENGGELEISLSAFY